MRYGRLPVVAVAGLLAGAPLALAGSQGQQGAGAGKSAAEGKTTAAGGAKATAELKNREGKTVGRVQLTDTAQGVLLRVNLEGAPAGERAFHIHQVGRCEPPAFESAGPHLNPTGAQHGYMNPKGAHAGDLPNVHVPQDGRLTTEIIARGVTLQGGANSLLDGDGAAIVMHAKPDDYSTDPSGQAGDRIACGVIQK